MCLYYDVDPEMKINHLTKVSCQLLAFCSLLFLKYLAEEKKWLIENWIVKQILTAPSVGEMVKHAN